MHATKYFPCFAPWWLLALLLAGHPAGRDLAAQQTLQVVTKRIHKAVAHQPSGGLQIDAQRADIHISTWDEDSLRLELRLIAKHPDKATATRELETMKYFMDRVGGTIVIRNFLAAGDHTAQPASALKAVYFLWVPAACSVEIRNTFGYVEIRGLRAPLTVSGSYCDMAFFDYAGDLKVDAYLGDIEGEGLLGNLSMETDRSAITLRGLAGKLNLKSRYGAVSVELAAGAEDMLVQAEKSDLRLSGAPVAGHRYSLSTQNGEIQVPEQLGLVFGQNRQTAWSESNRAAHRIDLRTTFGKIVIGE